MNKTNEKISEIIFWQIICVLTIVLTFLLFYGFIIFLINHVVCGFDGGKEFFTDFYSQKGLIFTIGMFAFLLMLWIATIFSKSDKILEDNDENVEKFILIFKSFMKDSFIAIIVMIHFPIVINILYRINILS